MLVSLFTDASLQPEKKTAGWGCWVRSERGRAWEGGSFEFAVSTSNEAEAWAIVRGLEFSLESGVLWPRDVIILQSDNKHVICSLPFMWNKGENMVQQPRPTYKRTELEVEALDQIQAFQKKHQVSVAGRWVKGHSRSGESRNYINNVCDRLARQGRASLENGSPVKHYNRGKEVHLVSLKPATTINWDGIGDFK